MGIVFISRIFLWHDEG